MTWTDEHKADFEKMWANGWTGSMIAKAIGCSPAYVYQRADKMGLPKRGRGGPGRGGKVADPTRQRRFSGVVKHTEGPRLDVKPWHPALRDGATIYARSVTPAAMEERLLKSGENNRKIGSLSTKGAWSGFLIFTLTLEERATCPRTCLEWATCYGNNMGMSVRIFDDGTLQPRLAAQLMHLQATHPKGFIVRLHVLGDFYSVDYVRFWHDALKQFPTLHIFGFTARLPDTEIGREIMAMRLDFPERCMIRLSGGEGNDPMRSEVINRAEQATGTLCPAQSDPDRSCATCGLCWTSDRTISFVRH